MLKFFRWILLGTVSLLILAGVAASVAFLYALEVEPLVRRSAPANYATVADTKAWVKRIKMQVESAGVAGTTLAVTEVDLNRLAQLGEHTFKWLSTRVEIDGSAINARMTAQMPANPFGQYLNLEAQVRPLDDGFSIDQVLVGPIKFSADWAVPWLARLADAVLQDDQTSQWLEGISDFQIMDDTALLTVSPPADVKARLKQAVRTLQAYRLPNGEQERVTHYYDFLVGESARSAGRSQSLSEYLGPLMSEAAKRSDNSSAVTENRAAIWALVIYFSNGSFETLIGKLVSSERTLVLSPYNVTLAGRRDLRSHFLYSAGITLATQQGIGIAAGEFKELLDSGSGGSGYSFVDIAADRAGVQFVSLATSSEEAATQLQEVLAANSAEIIFFPDTSGLIEGVSDEQFRQQYGDIESERYLQQVELIDRRIARLLLYREASRLENSE